MGNKKKLIKKMCATAVLSALAYVIAFVFHYLHISFVPGVSFLKYDPKDIIICIAGFALGPLYALGSSILVSLLEMVTISETGFYGFLMNTISTCAFVLPASFIYKNKKSLPGAIVALLLGYVSNIVIMTLWNIIITPIYMGIERTILVNNFLSLIILFNCIKTGFNVAFTLMLYKPIVAALRATRLMDKKETHSNIKLSIVIAINCLIVIAVLVGTVILVNKVG